MNRNLDLIIRDLDYLIVILYVEHVIFILPRSKTSGGTKCLINKMDREQYVRTNRLGG